MVSRISVGCQELCEKSHIRPGPTSVGFICPPLTEYIRMIDWVVDQKTFHCVHATGLSSFFDLDRTVSSAVRCIGPFGSESLSENTVRDAMKILTLQLEREYGLPQDYVVWGAYMDRMDYVEHSFSMLGSRCGFCPNITLRTELLSYEHPPELLREWSHSGGEIRHKSGIVFCETQSKVELRSIDLALIHPNTVEALIGRLSSFLPLVRSELGLQQTSARYGFDASQLVWTPSGSKTL